MHVWDKMCVGVQRDLYFAMPETFTDNLRMDAMFEQYGCMCMSQVMEANIKAQLSAGKTQRKKTVYLKGHPCKRRSE